LVAHKLYTVPLKTSHFCSLHVRNVNLVRLYDYMLCLFTHTHTLMHAVHLPCQHPHSVIQSFPILLFNYKHPAYRSHNIFTPCMERGKMAMVCCQEKEKEKRKDKEKRRIKALWAAVTHLSFISGY